MTKLIVDSYAWIEYFLSSDKGARIKSIVENEENSIYTHILSLAEIASRVSRAKGDYKNPLNIVLSSSEIIGIDNQKSVQAGLLHADVRKRIKDFGLVDACILLAARDLNAKILTGDPHFKGMKEAIMI